MNLLSFPDNKFIQWRISIWNIFYILRFILCYFDFSDLMECRSVSGRANS
ncbi:hypothetical protein GOB87_06200 [Acetobacter estunensis]|uniref:Uncharacterized protein n=1 Tax=Acetobacter estunensis TaxID=104097 RepID=A0A967EBJ9_9PROT|nr:hypothetical protein [Acetobacter estunensis]